jgi:hypothetical protein
VFTAWKGQKDKIVKRKKLAEKADSYNQKRMMRTALRAWNNIMMH